MFGENSMAKMKTGYVWEDDYTLHEMGYGHPESPRRLISIKDILDGNGVGRDIGKLEARNATEEELAYIHDENYIKRIAETAGRPVTHLDPDTQTNAYTWDAARLAAGGTIVCAQEVMEGRMSNAFALVRPPGHHAERGRAMGFCFFNNAAIAAEWLLKKAGLERVAIVDFDVHHGNGTQHAFYKRPDVFFASVHRDNFYPGTGFADEKGEGEGREATLNVPLSAGADDDDYRRAIEGTIMPAVERFSPQFIIASAGYDSHVTDPIGGMRVTTNGYRRIMRDLLDLAEATCDGKLIAVLEGGYDLKGLRRWLLGVRYLRSKV
jgi:acetoin utilization deacetylase AcuC-like enzyme